MARGRQSRGLDSVRVDAARRLLDGDGNAKYERRAEASCPLFGTGPGPDLDVPPGRRAARCESVIDRARILWGVYPQHAYPAVRNAKGEFTASPSATHVPWFNAVDLTIVERTSEYFFTAEGQRQWQRFALETARGLFRRAASTLEQLGVATRGALWLRTDGRTGRMAALTYRGDSSWTSLSTGAVG